MGKISKLKYIHRANIASRLLVREVKQFVSKTLLGRTDTVVIWVAFGLSQQQEKTESGE